MSINYYLPENLVKTEEIISSSGKYYLEIGYYKRQKDTWQYTRGTLYRHHNSNKQVIAIVDRNYSHFHHNFIQDKGVEYLVTGRSYMGLTIINCETGEEWNYNPTQEDLCSTRWYLSPDGKTLISHSCFWGGSYEYFFCDFDLNQFDSNKGLPYLTLDVNGFEEPWIGDCDLSFKLGSQLQEAYPKLNLNPEETYFVFSNKVEYNLVAKMRQRNLSSFPEEWRKVIPVDHQEQLTRFLVRWPDSSKRCEAWQDYIQEFKDLTEVYCNYLEDDCIVIVEEEAILKREDKRIVILHYRDFDPENLVVV